MTYPSHPARVEGDNRDQPGNAPDRPHGGKTMPVPPTHGGGIVTGSVQRPKDTHFDPAGNPIAFNDSSVTDQAAGGDLTGEEHDTRDDNFTVDDDENARAAGRQKERDAAGVRNDFNPPRRAVPGSGKT